MYDIISLDSKELSEIRDIAKTLNIPKIDRLSKQELVYKILDYQALNPPKEVLDQEKKFVKKEFRPRRQRTPIKTKPTPVSSSKPAAEPLSKAIFP